jgi:hypothetical protein
MRFNGLIIISALIAMLHCGCSENKNHTEFSSTISQHDCMQQLTDVIVHDILNPPIASRIYAYSNLAWYEAVKFTDSSASITVSLKGFDSMPVPDKNKIYNYSLAAAASFYTTAKTLVFSKDSIAVALNTLLQNFKDNIEAHVYNNSVALGEAIAAVILKRAAVDNYKLTRGLPRYSVFKEQGKWQQTPPDYADAVEPNWALLRPMLLDAATQCQPPAPPAYSIDKNSAYYTELMEVYNISKAVTPAMDTIARYWDDNPFVTEHRGHLTYATKKITPGGHWMGIISILCRQTKATIVKTAKAYALASCAIFDGFISCWGEKYKSRMVRPITVIREQIAPEWNSLLQTPPFPEYTSGHSVITAAAATVLTNIFGQVAFTDTTEMKYLTLRRRFNSIEQAADEAGISRLYGGIHFRSAINEGKKQGQKIGTLYNERFK